VSTVQLAPHVHVHRGGVNIGLIEGTEKRLILVDSGLDASLARKALRPFLETGYTLAAIINTHSHADHIGGNAELVKRTGCEVWAPAKERPWVRWPELEPLALYGGVYPTPPLQAKFLQAAPTAEVRELPLAPSTVQIAGVELELVPLAGHSLEQAGVAVEGVLFAADGLFHPDLIQKHPVIFLVNVAEYVGGLATIKGRADRYVVPGHGDFWDRGLPEGDPIPAVVDVNVGALNRLQQAILAAAAQPVTQEELLSLVEHSLGKVLDGEAQYFLDRAAVAAHISFLVRQNCLTVQFQGGRRQITQESSRSHSFTVVLQ